MAMSRRFYTNLADRYRRERADITNAEQLGVWVGMVRTTASAIDEESSGFNREKFYKACGYEVVEAAEQIVTAGARGR